MDPVTAAILGVVALVGTLVSVSTNRKNNEFIDKTNQENREFQEQTNLQNHQWSLEAAQWEYDHNKPQKQYADLLAAGITPAAAAQQVSGANVSYSPATAVAPQNMPKSTNMLNDGLQNVISQIGDFSSMSQAQAAAEKTRAETHIINETGVNKALAEIDKILADTEVSYSQKKVADSQVEVNNANIDSINANTELTNEKINTEKQTQQSIQLSNQEREIQLEFTRKTLEMSVQKTQAEIKQLSVQTAKLQEELDGVEFDNAYKQWVNTYIQTYGVAPDQGWQDMLFKSIADGNAGPLLDSLSQSLRQIYDSTSYFDDDSYRTPYQRSQDYSRKKRRLIRDAKPVNPVNGGPGYYSIGDWYGFGSSW